MKPVLTYFISGEVNGKHVNIIEDEMIRMFPNRHTTVFWVKSIKEKNQMLDIFNLEELEDPGLIDILWQAVDAREDGDSD